MADQWTHLRDDQEAFQDVGLRLDTTGLSMQQTLDAIRAGWDEALI